MEIYERQICESRNQEDKAYVEEIVRNFSDFVFILKEKHQQLKKYLFYFQMNQTDKQIDLYFIDTLHEFYDLTITTSNIIQENGGADNWENLNHIEAVRSDQLEFVKQIAARILEYIEQKQNIRQRQR